MKQIFRKKISATFCFYTQSRSTWIAINKSLSFAINLSKKQRDTQGTEYHACISPFLFNIISVLGIVGEKKKSTNLLCLILENVLIKIIILYQALYYMRHEELQKKKDFQCILKVYCKSVQIKTHHQQLHLQRVLQMTNKGCLHVSQDAQICHL